MKPEEFAEKLHALFEEAGLPSEISGDTVGLKMNKTYNKTITFRVFSKHLRLETRKEEIWISCKEAT